MWLFTKADEELHSILGHFHTVYSKLEVFIDKTRDKITGKNAQVKTLVDELAVHNDDIQKATQVQDNISKLLGS